MKAAWESAISPRAARIRAVTTKKIAPHCRAPRARAGTDQRWRSVASAGQLDAVSNSGFGDNQLRPRGVDLDLAPQIRDVDAQVLLRVAELAAPHRVEDLLVREGAVRLRHERPQDVPFDGREGDRVARAPHHPAPQVDAHPPPRAHAFHRPPPP